MINDRMTGTLYCRGWDGSIARVNFEVAGREYLDDGQGGVMLMIRTTTGFKVVRAADDDQPDDMIDHDDDLEMDNDLID